MIICAVLATVSGWSAPFSLRKTAEAASLRVRRSSREEPAASRCISVVFRVPRPIIANNRVRMNADRELLRESAAQIIAGDPHLATKLKELAGSPALAPSLDMREAVGDPSLEGAQAFDQDLAIETIVNRYGRPVLLIEGTTWKMDAAEAAVWAERLGSDAVKNALASVIPAVGRIEVENHELSWLGTGWLVAEDVIITNRHVAREFAQRGSGADSGFVFRQGHLNPSSRMSARVDFREEYRGNEHNQFNVIDILHIEGDDGPDMALLKVERKNATETSLAAPLRLATKAAIPNQYVATVGYPALDSRIPDQQLVRRLFGDVYDVKRLAPGQIKGSSTDEITHDCSTLGGNSGAPISDLESGEVFGLHYAGLYLRSNYGVPAAVIADRVAKVRSGRKIPGGKPEEDKLMPKNNQESGSIRILVSGADGETHTISLDYEGAKYLSVRSAGDPSFSAVGTISDVEGAVREAKRLLCKEPSALAVRAGFAFRNGWITDDPAVVVILRDSEARERLRLPAQLGRFPIEVRDPGPADLLRDVADLAEEGLPETTYKKPADFSLTPVTARMKVTCHLSPDAGWPTLASFLEQTTKQLTIGMYDFSGIHIVDAVREAVEQEPRTLALVLQDNTDSLTGSIKEDLGDIADTETARRLEAALHQRLNYASASVGARHQFASAYHIKVAVRDSNAFWLSSGNWQSTNQYPEPIDTSSWWALTNLNREWHVVIENAELAKQFERYLHYDLLNAQADTRGREGDGDEGVQILIEEEVFERRAPAGQPTYFEPLQIDRDVTVRPLLTPDNYFEETLALIEEAETEILFQNQSFSLLYDRDGNDTNDERFARLADALLAKQESGRSVYIIIRGEFNPQTPIERLKRRGFNMDRVRLQDHCHTKGIIIDQKKVLIGSHNWTNQGTLVNRDASLIFDDREIAEYFGKVFWFDWNNLARASIGRSRRVRPVEKVHEGAVTFSPVGMRHISLAELRNLTV